jgi:signal transduction histidine kinase
MNRRAAGRGLSGRLLALTVAFVMLGGVLLLLPSLARFRLMWIGDRIDAADLAVYALEATPDNMVSPELSNRLLAHVGAIGIAVHHASMTLMLSTGNPPPIDDTYDLRRRSLPMQVAEALKTLAHHGSRVMRVLAVSPKDASATVELIMDEAPLRAAMWGFVGRAMAFSLAISAITGALLYVSLRRLLVTPLRRLSASMIAFRENPEDATRVIAPEARSDELGLAQQELAAMQETVRAALRQKERLAALGTAVAKINHDLRNMLSTARLVSDGLAASAVPEVRRIAPRLLAAIDQAVALCTKTLSYTGEGAPPPARRRFALAILIAEAAELAERPDFAIANDVAPALTIFADRDQLFRVLQNLMANAAEAGARHLSVRARVEAGAIAIEIEDDGPGLPPKARENLFRPFAGSARPGGTGLGLAIAREIMRAHGGEISLRDSTGAGTVFVLTLPAPRETAANVVDIGNRRRETGG